MTNVLELRDLKKHVPRPVTLLWSRTAERVCALRGRLALLSLLVLALDCSFSPRVAPNGGVLASLCAVLSAAVSAALGLVCDARFGLYTLINDDAGQLAGQWQRVGEYLGAPVFAFDMCREVSPFPKFAAPDAFALFVCALCLFSCGRSREEPEKPHRTH
jgi:hypothetical protein